ncbi:NAD-dependent epimerase/dehydratase family protein [Magnetospirillum sp. SS-4]|uniref:NAD-dependent epimerase/dehydratase family protein n=1 Tax=Magnetospirillum sp. SS-4 TaxID=2681465 RepID=UPI0013826F7A|nr:NAD-dependent epimerase/dehydratase family protein [Magnetospirillum sp. SS-4]CAA7620713.1 Nucleotide sugar epimerase/dehydratase [Magnetospirillum sp. SS-4]
MNILITGICGQIGSHVADLLAARGDDVVGIENFATGRPEHLPARPGVRVVEGSIADRDLVETVFATFRPDVVIHTAASYKDPDDWHGDAMTNCVGGVNVIAASRRHGTGRFIYFQTALCYGLKPLKTPIPLDHPRNPANSSYAVSKTTAEEYLEISGLDYVTFRLANVTGPRGLSGPLPIFFQRLGQGKRCFVTKARRDFVAAKDLARVVIRAADGIGSGTYHFSSGQDVAIMDLYRAVVSAMHLNDSPEPEIRELGPDDAPSILLDPSRTFADFGDIEFTPMTRLVAEAVEYYKEFGVVGGYTHLKINADNT